MNEVGYSNTILKSHDETSLIIYEWSVPNPKAYIHLIHGMSEHAARYDHFAKWLNDKGYFVYSSDLRGHGKTAGDLSKVGFFAFDKGWDKVVSDLKLIHESYKHKSPTLSHIIMGHSMGSLLVRSLAIDHPKIGDGYILSATSGHPGIKGIGGEPLAKILGFLTGKKNKSKLLQDITYADFNKRIKNKKSTKDWLSRDENVVNEYLNDPYCMQIFSNQFFADLAHGVLITNNAERMKKMNKSTPVLLLSGANDPVGLYGKGVEEVFHKMKKANLHDVELKLFKDGRHEMINEINKIEVFEFIDNWIISKKLK